MVWGGRCGSVVYNEIVTLNQGTTFYVALENLLNICELQFLISVKCVTCFIRLLCKISESSQQTVKGYIHIKYYYLTSSANSGSFSMICDLCTIVKS